MKKLVLITVHGIGSPEENFSDDLKAGLEDRLEDLWSQVSVQPVWYSPIFQGNEDTLWQAMAGEPRNELDSTLLRKLFLFGFADATAFERSAHVEPGTYLAVQTLIRQALTRGYSECGDKPGTPVVVVAQSLGCQVFSSYAWDVLKDAKAQAAGGNGNGNGNGNGLDDFVRLKSWRHFITTGCNIPIFTAGLNRRVNFARLPGLAWDNYYDPDDVLGWPVKQLDPHGQTYDWVQDHAISAGNFLTGWNPASHLGYWTDKDVLKPIEQSIRTLLQ